LNLLSSVLARRGDPAGADPWGGRTLEWSTSSPPPPYNFDTLPEVRSDSPLVDLGPQSENPASPGNPANPANRPES
jgi:heme/copper-type cytochrome/quinol oxidase subunit 1